MKTYFLPAIKLSLVFLFLTALVYPLLIAGVGKLSPNKGLGERIVIKGKTIGYTNVAQKFTLDKYFNSRPSAVNYNAMGSAGSNKGPSNPDYLKDVSAKIDTFLKHNPGVKRQEIPSELVTYSGSGLDPDLSPKAAFVQVKRIAAARHLPESRVHDLVKAHLEGPFLGLLGPSKVNVLKLNIELDGLK